MIDRRTALAGVAALFGTTLFAPIARAAGLVGKDLRPVVSEGPPSVQVFTTPQRALMTQLSERVIPATDTPGAIKAGVPDYIEKMLADWALPTERIPILAGLDAIEARCVQDYKLPTAQASSAQLDALLDAAMHARFAHGGEFFEAFRQLVVTGYYTSEIGMTQEQEYLPVPGEYHGDSLYSKVNKVYTA